MSQLRNLCFALIVLALALPLARVQSQESRAPQSHITKAGVALPAAEGPAPQLPNVPAQTDIQLTSGTLVTDSLPAPASANSCSVRLTPQYFIVAPSGATQLRVSLSGNQDVDLFVRVDSRLAISGGQLNYTYKSDSFSNSEEIVITASSSPALRAANYYIVVANCGTGAANYTLTATLTGGSVACPTVGNLSPASGNIGSTVTLTGTNFTDVTGVRFSNNVTAQFTVNSATQLTATVPAGAVTGPLTLSKLGCADVQTASFNVTGACPTVSGLNPTSGAVGSSVVISGTNFLGVTAVRFANSVTASFTVLSDTQLAALVPSGAASGALTLSKPGCADVTTPAFTVTAGTASELALDDGVFESGLGLNSGGDYYILNRLTPASYPATLSAVSIYLTQLAAGSQLTLLIAPNPSGSATLGALTFTTYNVRVQALDQFNLYAVPGLTITAGDFLVGAKLTHAAGAFPAVVDQTPPSKQRSYRALDGVNFALIDSVNASFAGNFGVRARVVNTPAQTSCQTVSGINPTSGAPGASVTISGANFTGVTAVRFSNNVTAAFTVVNDTTITTTVPNGAVNGPLTISKPNCNDVQTAVFTVTQPPAPVPVLTSLNPATAVAGSAAFTLTVNGSSFVNGAAVRWNGGNRTTTFVSATQLSAAILASDLTAAGTAQVTVFNPASAGGGGGVSNALNFNITSNNIPTPVLTSLDPNTRTAGSPGFALTLNGTGFINASQVKWNGNDRLTAFINNTRLMIDVPASDVAAVGTATLTVTNPAPGGTSNALTFTITPNTNPVPALASLSPNNANAGGAAFTLTLTGTNFINGSVVRWNGNNRTTTFVSATQLTAAIPASDLATAGTAQVTVFNPTPGGGVSNAASFTINAVNPLPVISSLNPGSATAGRPDLTLLVSGSNFVNGAVVRWNGNNRSTTFNSATSLSAIITEADLATPGTANVTVFNPAPGGGLSNVMTFRITDPVPTITDLSPHTVTTGGPAFTLTITGFNFNAQSKVNWNDNERATTFINSKQLTATIPAADLTASGAANITVVNSAAAGGASRVSIVLINDLNVLAVDRGSPVVTTNAFDNVDSVLNRLTPTFYPATLSQVLIYLDRDFSPRIQEILVGVNPSGGADISGVAFQSYSPVSMGDEGRFRVYQVPNLTINSGDFVVGYRERQTYVASDFTPPLRGRSFLKLTDGSFLPFGNLLIRARLTQPCVSVANLNPTSGAFGTSVTLTGTNFTSVSAVKFANNLTAQFTVNSDTQITATVPNGAVTGPLTLSKQGCTDVQTGVFTIAQNPVPALTSLSPATTAAGGATFTLTVNGANFINGSVVRWNGDTRQTASSSATQLTAQISAADIANPGTAQVTVSNPAPGGGTSNALSFSIVQPNPVPTITSLSPNPVVAGSQAFTLTVNGTNFVNGAVVRLNNVDRPTAFSSATRLTAAIPAVDLANPGTARVTVFNPAPGGGASSEATLTILRAIASVSAASYLANELAPEAIAAGFGSNLATTTQAAVTTPLPTTLAGVTVSVRDSAGTERLAPLFFVAPTQINYQIPPNTATGAASVTVSNGTAAVALGLLNIVTVAPGLFSANADGQGVAAGVALRVTTAPQPNPTPALASLSPNAATLGGAAFTLTVNGGSFVNGAVVRWNNSERVTTFVSATQLRAAIPASDLAATGTASISAVNPAASPGGGGGVSNALTFAINNPAPTLGSLSHRTTTSGETGFTLTVNGSGFNASSVVRWNGQDRVTTFVSATQLRAEISAADLVSAGTGTVTVFNPPPGGGTSGSGSITIFDGSRDLPLTSGVTVNGNFDAPPPGTPPGACALRVFPQYTIRAPAGATQLRLALSSTQDLDLYARFAQRVDVTSTIVTDYRADGLTGNETITITPSSNPPLQGGGKYFVMVASCSNVAATFTLTATVTGGAAAEPAEPLAGPRTASHDGPQPENEPAYFFAAKIRPEESAPAVYEVTPWFWRWGLWQWLAPAQELTPVAELETASIPQANAATFSAAGPQQQQTFEPLARFDAALNRFVAVPLDLTPPNDDVFLLLFGTGTRLRNAANAVSTRIGGVSVPVGFAGPAPGLTGVEQFNVGPLPRALAGRGEVELVLTVDGKTANMVRIAIK